MGGWVGGCGLYCRMRVKGEVGSGRGVNMEQHEKSGLKVGQVKEHVGDTIMDQSDN